MRSKIAAVSCLALSMVLMGTAAAAAEGEIPITTAAPDAKALFIKARELAALGHSPEARKLLDDALAKDTDFVLALVYRSMLETDTAKGVELQAKAKSLVEKAKISDGEKGWVEYVGFALRAQQTQRLELIEKMAKVSPKDRWALLENGMLYAYLQQNDKAAEVLNRLVQMAPDFAPGYQALGFAQLALENFAEAEKSFKKLTDLVPKEVGAWDAQGWLQLKESKLDDASASFVKALALDPKFCSSSLGQGVSAALKGKSADAAKQFAKTLEIAQDDWCRTSAYFGSSLTWLLDNKADKAVPELEKMLSIYEKNKDLGSMANLSVNVAPSLIYAGRTKEVGSWLSKAVERYDKSAMPEETKALSKALWLLHAQALLAVKNGDLKTAKQKAADFKQTADKNPTPPRLMAAHQLAGTIAAREKRWDDAIAELAQANVPRSCIVMLELGEAYLAKGDKEKAKQLLTRAANFNELDVEFAAVRAEAKQKLASLK